MVAYQIENASGQAVGQHTLTGSGTFAQAIAELALRNTTLTQEKAYNG